MESNLDLPLTAPAAERAPLQGRISASRRTDADIAMSVIRGARDASLLRIAVQEGCAPADTLLHGLEQVRALGDPDRWRGCCRELQKIVERAA